MSKLAETLQAARRQSGLSLEHVERDTRIRAAHLRALERDDFRRLPSPVYTRGFVRTYATYLGLDPDYMVRLYDEAIGYRPQPVSLATDQPVRVGRLVTPNVAAIGVTLALAGIVFVWLYSAFFVSDPARSVRLPTPPIPTPTALAALVMPTATPMPQPTAPLISVTPALTASLPVVSTPTPASVAVVATAGGAQPSGTVVGRGTVTPTFEPGVMALKVKVVDAPSWVQVRTDGVVTFSGTLPQGSERLFSAKNELFIHAGRADAVDLTLNGVPQGRLGNPGQAVVRRTFTPSG
jgi:cytoskeletal protein RodZ